MVVRPFQPCSRSCRKPGAACDVILTRHWAVVALSAGAILWLGSISNAQPRQDPPGSARQPAAANEDDRERVGPAMPMNEAPPEMREMARSMKSMADMCQTMMEREQQYRPYVLTAGGIVVVLLFLALLLFVVLEVQWIRFWALRIKTERQKLP